MAKITGPLFSASASGSIAGALTYQPKMGGGTCRRMPTAKPKNTQAQLTIQAAMRSAQITYTLCEIANVTILDQSINDIYPLDIIKAATKQGQTAQDTVTRLIITDTTARLENWEAIKQENRLWTWGEYKDAAIETDRYQPIIAMLEKYQPGSATDEAAAYEHYAYLRMLAALNYGNGEADSPTSF